MNKARDMKVIYLNDWLSGSWQVQKIHAQEFINAFKHQKGLQVFTYPRNKVINLRSKAVNGNKIITDILYQLFNFCHENFLLVFQCLYLPVYISRCMPQCRNVGLMQEVLLKPIDIITKIFSEKSSA